jgi:hypothetical protein
MCDRVANRILQFIFFFFLFFFFNFFFNYFALQKEKDRNGGSQNFLYMAKATLRRVDFTGPIELDTHPNMNVTGS